jgi:proteic killer suppression protein
MAGRITVLHGMYAWARLRSVIVSFGDRATEALFHGEGGKGVRRLPRDIHATAQRKLDLLNAATALLDLRAPPGNRLEALKGDLKGHHSIRINDPWRIVFRWTASGPEAVRITDYH